MDDSNGEEKSERVLGESGFLTETETTERDHSSDEEKRVTSVMDKPLFDELERWRKERGISRSEAVRELVQDGMRDETWQAKVTGSQEVLEGEHLVAIVAAGLGADGDGPAKIHARQGLDVDLGLGGTEQGQALLLLFRNLLNAYADLAGTDVKNAASSIVKIDEALKQQDAAQDFDLGGGNER